MKILKKSLASLLLGLMMTQSLGLGNIAYANENTNAGNSETTIIVESADAATENSETNPAETLRAATDATRTTAETRTLSRESTDANGQVVESVRITVETKNENGNEKLEYLTGEPIKAFIWFTISRTSSELRNTKLRLKIPKTNINIGTIGSFNEVNPVRSGDADYYIATWNWNSINGGQVADVAFDFNMIQPQTPDGFTVPVIAEFLDENNTVLKTTEKQFVGKTQMNPIATKTIREISGGCLSTGCDRTQTIEGKTVVAREIRELQENEMTHTKTGENAPFVTYQIGLRTDPQHYGNYLYSTIKITEKLPQWAVMYGEADSDGFYTYSGDKWKYDAASHTAIFEGKPRQYFNSTGRNNGFFISQYAIIKLTFPNQPYTTLHENKATVTIDPNTPHVQELPEVAAHHKWYPVKYVPPAPVTSRTAVKIFKTSLWTPIFKKTLENTEVPITWNIQSRSENFTDESIDDVTMITEIMDENPYGKLYFQSIKIPSQGNSTRMQEKIKAAWYQVIGQKYINNQYEDHILYESNEIDKEFIIADTTGQYERIGIRFKEAIESKNEYIYIHVTTIVKEDIWKKWQEADGDNDLLDKDFKFGEKLFNRGYVYYHTNRSPAINTKMALWNTTFVKEDLKLVSTTSGGQRNYIYGQNWRGSISYTINFDWNSDEKPKAQNVKHITLLPKWINFDPSALDQYRLTNTTKQLTRTPEVIQNFQGTGQTAVVFHFDELIWGESVNIRFFFQPTAYASEWDNVFEHFTIWDNNTEIVPHSTNTGTAKTLYTDTLDLDNDGDTSETFLRGTTTINFTPPREIIIKKQSSLDGQNWFFDSPMADINTDAFYKISVFNNSLLDRNGNLTIIDTLPYVGDHKIVPEQDGSFLPRESAFPVSITQSLESIPENAEVLKKWSVFYTTSAQGDSLESVRDANYVPADQITDFTKVKSIKLVLNGSIASGETNEFILKGKIPNNKNLTAGQKAVNSVALSYNNQEFAEANFASIPVAVYEVSGKIFVDNDKNGDNTDTDAPLGGYTLLLKNADGTPALDDKKQPIKTTSSATGEYSFKVYKRGDYKVEIEKKSQNDEITTLHTERGTTGNDGKIDDTNTVVFTSDQFTLSPTSLTAVRNFGFILSRGSITLVKKNPTGENLAGVTFRIEKNGQKIGESKTTNNEGKIIWEDMELGDYTLIEETTLPEYRLDTTPIAVTISQAAPNITKEVINQKQLWNIKIIKKSPDGQLLAGASFELRKWSETWEVVGQGTSNNRGEIIFTNIEYGNYVLVEKAAPRGYVKGGPVAINATTFTKTKTEVSVDVINQKDRGTLNFLKIEAGNDTIRPAGASFELREDSPTGRVVGTAASDQNGFFRFSGLEYRDYYLIETEAPKGYIRNTEPIHINKDDVSLTAGRYNLGYAYPVENTKQFWNLRVTKKTEDGNILPGATFELRKGDISGPVVGTAKISGNDGQMLFENLEYTDYTLVETNSPIGYTIMNPISIPKERFEAEKQEITMDAVNTKQRWDLKILKTGKNNAPLAGATFELRAGSENGQIIGTAQTSNENGEIIFTNLEYNNYVLVETAAPTGYKKKAPTLISTDMFTKEQAVITKTITNEVISQDIILTKTGEDNKILSGATFELRKDSPTGTLIATSTTNDAGNITFSGVEYGKYFLVETEAPMGYLVTEPQEIFVGDNSEPSKSIAIVDKNQLWNLKITKVDTHNSQKLLAGATFALKDETGKVVQTKTTDQKGELLFENLIYWDYTISETKAPSGYLALTEDIPFSKSNFDKNKEILELSIKNTREPTPSGPGGCIGNCGGSTPPTFPSAPPAPEPKPSFSMEFTDPKPETKIVTFPKRMPRTGYMVSEEIYEKAGIVGKNLRKNLITDLPDASTFRLAGSKETHISHWLQVLPESDRNADKYIVIPSQGLVMPINSVNETEKSYSNFIHGKNEDFAKYLQTGAVELPGTSTRGYGEAGNKVIGGHSSYWKNAAGRYKTHFQKIIGLENNAEIWIYEKNTTTTDISETRFTRYVYRVTKSENLPEQDISALKPTSNSMLTLFTCTPIGGITGRWVVTSEFVGKFMD